jgi:NADH:ubiquinone oxidoreductase subunit E
MDHCTQGVVVKIDDEFIDGISKENLEEVFDKYVLDAITV